MFLSLFIPSFGCSFETLVCVSFISSARPFCCTNVARQAYISQATGLAINERHTKKLTKGGRWLHNTRYLHTQRAPKVVYGRNSHWLGQVVAQIEYGSTTRRSPSPQARQSTAEHGRSYKVKQGVAQKTAHQKPGTEGKSLG